MEIDEIDEIDKEQESFADFKASFAYGSRTDLNFKFLKRLSDQKAAQFLQELLHKLGDTLDDGNTERIAEHVLAWQTHAYGEPGRWQYDSAPFSRLSKPLSAARIALLTSSGHFVEGNDPEPFGIKNMDQAEAEKRIDDFLKTEPVLSEIPVDTPAAKLRVRHGGYDIRSVQADPNVAFPIEHMRDLAQAQHIGELAPVAYSFVGACAQTRLLKHQGPQWVDLLHQQAVEGVVLTPV